MNTRKPRSGRLSVKMQAADIAEMDRLAAFEDISRANWARKLIRRHLREIAASPKPEAVA